MEQQWCIVVFVYFDDVVSQKQVIVYWLLCVVCIGEMGDCIGDVWWGVFVVILQCQVVEVVVDLWIGEVLGQCFLVGCQYVDCKVGGVLEGGQVLCV